MGCSSSSRVNVSSLASVVIPDDSYTGSRYWVRSLTEKEARDDFEADGIFKCAPDRTLLELRALLDYPIGRQSLSKNCLKSNPCVHILLAGWLDIQRYNAMMPGSSKLELAYSINKTYIQPSSLFPSDQILGFNEVLNSPEKIQSGIFDETQSLMFTKFHDLFFLQFISTPEYDQMCCALRRKYNRVKQSDFLYHQIIGKGGFGVVAEVSKKSTGVRYAMKLQRKDYIKTVYDKEVWRVSLEARSLANCHHPFIIELHFAFQTPTLIAMVTSLGTGRDLSRVLKVSGPLTMEQVRFYAAEITSALSYIHDKGLVYRDLKPGNVLLNMDGHIQLVDFGGVADTNKHGSFAPENISPVLTPEDAAANLTDRQPPLSHYWSNNKPTREDSAKDGDDFVLASSFGGFDADSIRSLCHAASPRVMRTLKDTFPDLDEFFILRHLSVCDGDLEKTVVHIENCLRWRYSFLNYDKVPRHQASGSGGFWYTHGYDCLGHPLLIYTSRLMSPDNRDMDEFVRWIVWMYEIAIKRMPPDVHRVTILVNRLGQKQTDFESQRTMFPLFRKMYPNIVYKFIFYPASIALRAASGVIKNFAGRAAINTHVLNSIAALRKEIPDEYIPEEMGGSCSYKFDIADYPSPEICEPNEYVIEKSSELTTMASAVTTYRPGETSDLVPVELGNSNPMSMSQPGVPIAPPAEGFLQRSNSIVGSHGYMVNIYVYACNCFCCHLTRPSACVLCFVFCVLCLCVRCRLQKWSF